MHGLQQPSFFPTAKELSSGVQWFKDHPVLAAAAATAVSVITYLNALELEDAADGSEPSRARRLAKPSLSRKSSGHNSDGKLSAAVSWCDEHGGSLTQVFEAETRSSRRDDSDSDDDVAESFLEPFVQHRQLTTLRKSCTTQTLADMGAASPSEEGDAVQTESPQWGWYVPITPPQDQFVQNSRELVVASCSEEVEKPMRRSVSGSIS